MATETVKPSPAKAPRQRELRYKGRRADEGFKQVKLWVPEEVAGWLLDFAEGARSAARLGIDISEDLPAGVVNNIVQRATQKDRADD